MKVNNIIFCTQKLEDDENILFCRIHAECNEFLD